MGSSHVWLCIESYDFIILPNANHAQILSLETYVLTRVLTRVLA